MPTQSLPLIHLIRPSTHSGRAPLLLLLHGVGGNEQNLWQLLPHFDERFLVMSLRGPLTLGQGSYAWFHVDFSSGKPVIVPEEAEASRVKLLEFIAEAVKTYAVDPSQVYLTGFSQGAIISASVALTAPQAVNGVAMLSGRILPEIRPKIANPEQLKHLRFLVQHGVYDSKLPITHAQQSRALLEELGVQLTYREYPMNHEISEASLSELKGWLNELGSLP